jgi:hypothetical protein
MATRCEYATNCLPIVSVAAEASGDNMAFNTISYEIQRNLSGNGSIDCDFATVYGFNNGAVAYQNGATSGGSILYPFTGSTFKIVHIKHTGYIYSSATVLGASSTDNLIVYLKKTSDATLVAFATLSPGGSLIIPIGTGVDFSDVNIGFRSSSATNTIAVEVMATT